MRGHSSLKGTPFTHTGIVTGMQVGNIIPVNTYGSFRVDVVGTRTVVGSVSLILQVSPDGQTWSDTKTVSMANGVNSFKFLDTVIADQTYLPLPAFARVALTTTDVADVCTISSIIS